MKASRTSPFLIGFLLITWGCSASSPPDTPEITVSIDQHAARVHVNRSVQFTATVHHSANTAVTWSISGTGCSGAACGMISSAGFYTAPGNVPVPADVVIKATSVADSSKSSTATVTILPAVIITVSSPYPTLAAGWTRRFSAEVQNADDPSVTWTLSGPGCIGAECGTLSTSGFYQAPSQIPSLPAVTITATSVEDPLMSGSATIDIVPSGLSIEWTWMSGNYFVDTWGQYGQPGVPAPSNVPGAREGSVSWSEPGGGLWLFGGRGYATNALEGFLNDLWRFDPATGEWTWISGSNSKDQHGSFGSRGLADPSNVPAARYDSVSWLDPAGNFWLFGGYGILLGTTGWADGNDLWKYDPVSREWTWISGSSEGDQPGVYGTKGVADPSNVPGSRHEAISWADPSGALWLFGGFGFGSDSGRQGMLNDLWKYDPLTNEWTWVSGSDSVDQAGVYGTKGSADPANTPGGKYRATSWVDLGGHLWLFGGGGPGYDHFNDLWMFDPSTREWTWVAGSEVAGQAGVYGTKGLADPSNVPGGRSFAVSFRDPAGRLWLFGGAGYDSAGDNLFLNDLWMFDPATCQWTWAGGSDLSAEIGIYGIKGEGDPANRPGARYSAVSWVDDAGAVWLFGGYGNGSANSLRFLNDLWRGIR